MESIEVSIFAPTTAAYSEEELATMETWRTMAIRLLGLLKVTSEEHLITLNTKDREEVRKHVIELCNQYYPRPLFVKLNSTLNRTFLLDKRYHEEDSNLMLETITYSYSEEGLQIQRFIWSKMEEFEEIRRSKCWPSDVISLFSKIRKGRRTSEELNELYNEYIKNINSELRSRYGINGPFKGHPSRIANNSDAYLYSSHPYNTRAEIVARDQRGLDVYTIINNYIEEKGRFIQKSMIPRSTEYYIKYYREVHPELIGAYFANNMK